MQDSFQDLHNALGNRQARPGETIQGSAGSLAGNYIVVYPVGSGRNGVICRFRNPKDQWECYCNDVLLEIDPEGYVSSFDITKRRDSQ